MAVRLGQANNITKERLASYDRPITSEPKFSKEQSKQLRQDLAEYLQTLKVCPYATGVQALQSPAMYWD
jgi:hypothetical protein